MATPPLWKVMSAEVIVFQMLVGMSKIDILHPGGRALADFFEIF